MNTFFLLLCLLLPLLLLTGCDTTGPDDETIAGVDVDRLFVPPTAAELAAIEADWAGRDVSVQGFATEQDTLLAGDPFGGPATTVRVVSHTVGGVRHYGAVIAPEDAAARSLPVLLYLHGDDAGVDTDSESEVMLALQLAPALRSQFVIVVPSFRSETLRAGGRAYRSGGDPSPWDYDVDDALALLNAALASTPAADPARIGALGFSRGATVAMLAAVRDPRIELVVAFFGPTNFQGAFARQLTEQALRSELPDLPGIDHLDDAYLQPLKAGTTGYDAVRLALIRRSPLAFAGRLPQLQLHHGTADTVVPVTESEALDAVLRAAGRTAPGYEFYRYPGGGHHPLFLSGSLDRTGAFLSRLLPHAARVPFAVAFHARRTTNGRR